MIIFKEIKDTATNITNKRMSWMNRLNFLKTVELLQIKLLKSKTPVGKNEKGTGD